MVWYVLRDGHFWVCFEYSVATALRKEKEAHVSVNVNLLLTLSLLHVD